MGFMGLKHWVESDNAADFRGTLQDTKGNKIKLKKAIAKELKLRDNEYNTDGFINIALILEDEGKKFGADDITPIISHLISRKQYQYILNHLRKLTKVDWSCQKESLRLYRNVEKKYFKVYNIKA